MSIHPPPPPPPILGVHMPFAPVRNFTQNSLCCVVFQVHFFEFPDDVDTVTVEAEASNKRCAILSVQNVTVSIHIMFLSVLLVHVYARIS